MLQGGPHLHGSLLLQKECHLLLQKECHHSWRLRAATTMLPNSVTHGRPGKETAPTGWDQIKLGQEDLEYQHKPDSFHPIKDTTP